MPRAPSSGWSSPARFAMRSKDSSRSSPARATSSTCRRTRGTRRDTPARRPRAGCRSPSTSATRCSSSLVLNSSWRPVCYRPVARPRLRRLLMFSLTVIDHVRLDCEHVARNYTMHARAADRFASLSFGVRIVMAALLAAAAAACVSSALLPARFYQLAAVGATTAAMIGFALYSVLGLEARVSAHRSFAHRLWIVTERYRSLLAEANDGIVDVNAIL